LNEEPDSVVEFRDKPALRFPTFKGNSLAEPERISEGRRRTAGEGELRTRNLLGRS